MVNKNDDDDNDNCVGDNNYLCCDDSDAICSNCAKDESEIYSSAESNDEKSDCCRGDQEQLFYHVHLHVRDRLLRLHDSRMFW